MARAETNCEVLHQDFLALDLPLARFDGIFANASLFHVPSSELARVLRDLAATLKADGVLFCSNPRGHNEEGWAGGRYGCFHDLETWRTYVTATGFSGAAPLLPAAGPAAGRAAVARHGLAQEPRDGKEIGQALERRKEGAPAAETVRLVGCRRIALV